MNNVVEQLFPLYSKDISVPGNGIDASNQGTDIHIANWLVRSLYLPDAIHSYTVGNIPYIIFCK